MSNTIRFIIAAILMVIGLIFYIIQFIGIFRFKYVMNRMHAAALGDTLGSGCMTLGVLVLSGFNLASLKIILMIAFLWVTAPVCTHMLARLEVMSRKSVTECADLVIVDGEDDEEAPDKEEAV